VSLQLAIAAALVLVAYVVCWAVELG